MKALILLVVVGLAGCASTVEYYDNGQVKKIGEQAAIQMREAELMHERLEAERRREDAEAQRRHEMQIALITMMGNSNLSAEGETGLAVILAQLAGDDLASVIREVQKPETERSYRSGNSYWSFKQEQTRQRHQTGRFLAGVFGLWGVGQLTGGGNSGSGDRYETNVTAGGDINASTSRSALTGAEGGQATQMQQISIGGFGQGAFSDANNPMFTLRGHQAQSQASGFANAASEDKVNSVRDGSVLEDNDGGNSAGLF